MAIFSAAFQRVHSIKRGVLGELKLSRIPGPLHVAMITRAGQRSRKAVSLSRCFLPRVLASLLPTSQRFSLKKVPR